MEHRFIGRVMSFPIVKCPKCKNVAEGTCELMTGIALLEKYGDTLEYFGETEWHDQNTESKDGAAVFWCHTCSSKFTENGLINERDEFTAAPWTAAHAEYLEKLIGIAVETAETDVPAQYDVESAVVQALCKLRRPVSTATCGHSACTKNYVEFGDTRCIAGSSKSVVASVVASAEDGDGRSVEPSRAALIDLD